eukprot:TRINITY_DN3381_c0_g2_i5.p1 TRINITY_DN3381_c0_g2~~TRINITY_DN3381_c0_g2_i5.p1  ORF type:complete len:623 (+),score=130.80 TRINITY_DN3381_c0_g2_i5:162-2030(+)
MAQQEVEKVLSKENLEEVAKELGDLARNDEHRDIIVQLGGGEILVKLLSSESIESRALSARAIGNLCYEHQENCEKLQQLGVIPLLTQELLSTQNSKRDHPILVKNLAGALGNISSKTQFIQEIIKNQGIKALLGIVESGADETSMGMAIKALSNISEIEEAQILMAETDLIDIFLEILNEPNSISANILTDVLETLECLARVPANRLLLVDKGKAIPKLFQFIQQTYNDLERYLPDPSDAPEESSEPLPILASQYFVTLVQDDAVKRFILVQGMLIPIVTFLTEKTANYSPPTTPVQTCQVKILRLLSKVIGVSSLSDEVSDAIIPLLPSLIKISTVPDADILLGLFMVFGNLARNDEQCIDMVEEGIHDIIITTIKNYPNDQRILHLGLTALRNLSIAPVNRQPIFSSGVLEVTVSSLSAPNQVIQFAAIGVLKNIIVGNEVASNSFLELGGLQPLLDLSRDEGPKLEVDPSSSPRSSKKDSRVQYESTRLLIRLLTEKEEQVLAVSGDKIIYPLQNLLISSFPILQQEGALALQSLSKTHGKLIAQDQDSLKSMLVFLSNPSTPIINDLLQTLINAIKSDPKCKENLLSLGAVQELKQLQSTVSADLQPRVNELLEVLN